MMARDTSIPAFPMASENGEQYGMSLRDAFAMQSIGLLTVTLLAKSLNGTVKVEDCDEQKLAQAAYEMADAMLAERQKP